MDARKLKITLLLALLLSVTLPARAQTSLTLLTPVTGSVAPGELNTWTFTAQNGAVLSFALTSQTDGFDPQMGITDSSGHAIVSSDDYNYPDSLDPLLEAITMPRTDTYTLTVAGFNNTSGDYALTMLPGYGVSAYGDGFDSTQWSAHDRALTALQSNDQLNLSVQGARQSGSIFDDSAPAFGDFYAQAQVSSISDPSGWVVGMALRRVGTSYYLLSINSQGNWRFTLMQDGSESVIRDWTPHPNIVPGADSFSIGVLARAVGFDFFYNSGYIGSSSDSTLSAPGQVGLMVGTFSSQPSRASATFDDLLVTTPTEVGGEYVIPQEVLAGDGTTMVQALRRNHVVSAAGEMSLTIGDSSVEYARPGINRVMLGRGARYRHFAFGTTVNLNASVSDVPAGCGLVFGFNGETDYTLAFFDQAGEYGVSQRSSDTFSPGLYGVDLSLGAGQHHLLVIADDHKIYYYIDRKLVGTVDEAPQEGEVGIAVVNFESAVTSCEYTNFWLWKW